MFDSDRRKYPRANYPCRLTMWLDNESNETILSNTTNVGLGGLCVHVDQAVDVGTKLDIQLGLPNLADPFRCRGVVVRCFKEKEKYFNVGVRFEPLDEPKYILLAAQISQIINMAPKEKI